MHVLQWQWKEDCVTVIGVLPLSAPTRPAGLEFPWGPKPFAEVVAGPLLRSNRQTTDSSALEGSYVGVYFSAHWVSALFNLSVD